MKNCLSAVLLLTFASVAWGGAILTVGNSSDNEAVGNMVEVDLTIFGLPATLDSYQFDVDFTPGVLSAMGTGSGTIDNVSGTITGMTGCRARKRFSLDPYLERDLVRLERNSDSLHDGGRACICGRTGTYPGA